MIFVRALKNYLVDLKTNMLNNQIAINIVKNSGWLVANSLLSIGLGVFVVGVVARYFGPTKFGQFNYATAFVSLFISVANLGLENLIVKNILDEEWDEGTILCTGFVLRLLGGLVLATVTYILIRIIEPDDTSIHTIVLLVSLTMVTKASEVIEYWVQAYHKAKILSITKMLIYVLISIIKILVAVFTRNIILYAFVYLIDSVAFGMTIAVIYFKIREKRLPWKFNIKYAKQLLGQSWYLMLSGLFVSLYNRIDQVMLGTILKNKAEVGIYAAAVTIAEIWYFIPMSIITSFKPIVMVRKRDNESRYYKTMQTLYNIVSLISIFFCSLISIFSKLIVSILYGEQFTRSANMLVILVWAGTFAMLGSSRSLWLVTEGLQKYSIFYTFVSFIVNVVINYFLIPLYGGYGAAIATLLAQFVNIVSLSFFDKTKISSKMIFKSFLPKFKNKAETEGDYKC